MNIERIENSVFGSNTYIVAVGEDAVVIDMGDFRLVIDYVTEHSLNVKALLITHTHYDHIYGVRDFMDHFPDVPIYTSENGKAAFNNSAWNFSRYHNDPITVDSDRIIILNDGDRIDFSNDIHIDVISTPGHDWSCLSFKLDDTLFTGDSYIPGVKVVSSFPKSDRGLAKVWYSRLESMSKAYDIYPGHGVPFPRTGNCPPTHRII